MGNLVPRPVMRKGQTHVVHFVGGIKRTIPNVQRVWENEMTHLLDGEGREWIINKANVLCVEVIP